MKYKNLYYLLSLTLLFQSCLNREEFSALSGCASKDLEANITIDALKAKYSGVPVKIEEDLTLEGYIISDDTAGNFYRMLHLQDKPANPSGGIQISIDMMSLHLFYARGERVVLRLKGLYLYQDDGAYVLGTLHINSYGQTTPGRIPPAKVGDHLYLKCDEMAEIKPLNVTVDQLKDGMINTLISISGVQMTLESLCVPYANPEEDTDRILEDCQECKVVMRNSGYAEFQSEIPPTLSGTVTGVLGKDKERHFLRIRDLSDINLNQPRCHEMIFSCQAPKPNISIQQLLKKYTPTTPKIEQDDVLEVEITANDASGNFSKELYVRDETGALCIAINATSLSNKGFEIGRKLKISARGLFLDRLAGRVILQDSMGEGIPSKRLSYHIYLSDEKIVPKPLLVSASALNKEMLGQLVTLEGYQFKSEGTFVEKNKDTYLLMTNCGDSDIGIFTHKKASFGLDSVPVGNGSVTGILAYTDAYYIRVRDLEDVHMDSPRITCIPQFVNQSNQVFISEIADPENEAGARFIELYNAGKEAVSLDGWSLRRYTNANPEYSAGSVIDLTGQIIPPESTLVIAAAADTFKAIYGFAPDLEGGTNGAAGSNGDDNMELVNAEGEVADVFGVPGEDGTATNHDFADGRALRASGITKANPIYDPSEWIITHKLDAPEGFKPGKRD